MSLRTKFIITNILLLFALAHGAITAQNILEAFQRFQIRNTLARRGDVRMIRPWMTIFSVVHAYHVPESYLYHSQDLPNFRSLHYITLQELSTCSRCPIGRIIYKVKNALLAYRRSYPQASTILSPCQNATMHKSRQAV